MKSLLTLSLIMLLGGCASQPDPAERPYSDAEIKQFSLELLSRSGLPYEDYERIRRALTTPSHRMSNAIKDSQPDNAKRG
ncbi:hypothetical protein FBY03_101258 [Pseudomonas sp. SJZ079]|uniref:hypothetical protein n=1 Tax=Pseudomonas sp. SJZ079 TaxID=2572887 RepID=UPI00119A6494|nr:hypothetical protein [Pseudomonas sp. SJZ079]TWC43065.1 hypothetical protein FBY03_101258 [Pseudomonas sp. SJZ079]